MEKLEKFHLHCMFGAQLAFSEKSSVAIIIWASESLSWQKNKSSVKMQKKVT